jgi:RNA polymerase sigma-70 factor (ECF subfamily)
MTELLAAWLARRRGPLLRFFRRRMPAGADQKDLVQEVFLRLARRPDLRTIERVDSHLFEAAANVLTDWRRRQATRAAGAHEPITDGLAHVGASPERVLLGRDTVRALVEALGAAPERTRTIFMLYHFEHLTHAEIGRRLGVAVRTVEDHMARANLLLVARMKEPGA